MTSWQVPSQWTALHVAPRRLCDGSGLYIFAFPKYLPSRHLGYTPLDEATPAPV